MHDCLILGSGRSGTSMVTGALARAGYAMGTGLHAARVSNPKGFFESPEINGINESLLAPILRARPVLAEGQRWLGVPEPGQAPRADAALTSRMRRAVAARPFCFKDPRFSFTLPAWRPVLGDARFVCVFRHPTLTAHSMAEEIERAEYLRGLAFDDVDALALWSASYSSILDELADDGDWLFLHYDQVVEGGGLERLSGFLDADVDTGFPDRKLRRPAPDQACPPQALELYERLCARAEHEPASCAVAIEDAVEYAPLVSVLVHVERADVDLDALAKDVGAQRGVRTELIVLDHTRGGLPARDDMQFVRATSPSRGASARAALALAGGAFVAWHDAASRLLPARLAHAVEVLADADIVTCDYHLHDDQGQYVETVFPAAMGDAPGPFWSAGLVARRAVVEELLEVAFLPVELELWRRLHAQGRAGHVSEPGFSVHRAHYAQAWDASREDAALVVARRAPFAGERPRLSVSICTFNRCEVLVECLEAFSRQTLPPGTFELVVVDDGSSDGTGALLTALEEVTLPVPMRVVRQANGGLSAARNAGLEVSRGKLVLFVNDDTIPHADCVEQHLGTHAALGYRTAVLGTFEQPPDALDNALMRYLEGSTEVFGYSGFEPGQLYDGLKFYTCNVSVSLDAVREAGAFDPSFRHYGCEDTDLGLRLEALGFAVYYEANARALHRHLMDFDYIQRRQRTVARAYVRLFAKHPTVLGRWGIQTQTALDCDTLLRRTRADVPAAEDAARELSRLDVGALQALGGQFAEAATDVLARIGELLPRLNRVWWNQGYLEGLREHGLAGFPELWAARERQEQRTLQVTRRTDAPEISVIVPTHNRPRELAQLLDSLAAQDLGPGRFEVFVVDDESSEPAADVLGTRSWPFHLEVLRQRSAGPGAARNRALARARGELVVFFNDDAVVAPDNLRRHLLAQRTQTGPVAVVGTFTLLPELVTDSFTRHVETSNALFAQPLLKAGVLYGGSSFCTGNLSIRRALLTEVGGFDEAFPYAGGEDSELGIRLERRLGLQVAYEPRARAQHDHALDVGGYAVRQRVLGWAAQRIETLHAGAGLVPDWPLDDAAISALRAEQVANRAAHDEVVAAAAEICADEARNGQGGQHLPQLRPAFEAIREYEFQRGLLAALDGELPLERASDPQHAELAPPTPTRGPSRSAPERPRGPATTAEPAAERAAATATLVEPDLERALAQTEGMVSVPEARLLFDLAAGVRRGAIVEVGSYRGRSTVALALGAQAGARPAVYAVDPHEEFVGVLGGQFGPADRGAFFRTMLDSGAFECVRLVNLSSEVVAAGWSTPVELLWLDGDHSYEGVARDFQCWQPHLLDGAIVAFDDATDRALGPWRLIRELRERRVLQVLPGVGKVRVFRYRASS